MKILGIIVTTFLTLIISYFLMGIGTILKNGTSLTETPGTATRLKLFLSKNSAETAENSPFPELLPKHVIWDTAKLNQFTKQLIQTAESLGYQLQETSKQHDQANGHEKSLHFTITTKTFKFIDDLYINISIEDKGFIINAKSSSRTGRADFGANLGNIRKLFAHIEQTF